MLALPTLVYVSPSPGLQTAISSLRSSIYRAIQSQAPGKQYKLRLGHCTAAKRRPSGSPKVRWWETEEGQQGLQAVKQDYGGERTKDNRFRVDRELDEFEELGLLAPTVRPGLSRPQEAHLISAEKVTALGVKPAAMGSDCSDAYLCTDCDRLVRTAPDSCCGVGVLL